MPYKAWTYSLIICSCADRASSPTSRVQAQRMLSISHLIAGAFMIAGGIYCSLTPEVHFSPLFTLYTVSVAFFMPTIGLCNSVAFNALTKANLDTVKEFPPIRIWGTIRLHLCNALCELRRSGRSEIPDFIHAAVCIGSSSA